MNFQKGQIYFFTRTLTYSFGPSENDHFIKEDYLVEIESVQGDKLFLYAYLLAGPCELDYPKRIKGFDPKNLSNIKEVQKAELPMYLWLPFKTELFGKYLRGE